VYTFFASVMRAHGTGRRGCQHTGEDVSTQDERAKVRQERRRFAGARGGGLLLLLLSIILLNIILLNIILLNICLGEDSLLNVATQ
jgi:hypothetical protein